MGSQRCCKRFISLATGACLPLLPGQHPVLHLSHFLPVARAHHRQLSPTPSRKRVVLVMSLFAWLLTPAHNSSCGHLVPLRLLVLTLRCCKNKTNQEEKQLITLFPSQTPADVSGWFLCSPLASGDLQGCVLLFTVYTCQNGGKLHVCVRKCLTTNTWVFRKAVRSVVLWLPRQRSLHIWYCCINFIKG